MSSRSNKRSDDATGDGRQATFDFASTAETAAILSFPTFFSPQVFDCETRYAQLMSVDSLMATKMMMSTTAAPHKGWHSTSNAARIAGIIQHFASRDTSLSRELGLKLLRVLNLIVDTGDRSSAALQLSEIFREIRAG
jgi:hypothetical protein